MPRLDPAVAAVRSAVRTFLRDRLDDGTLRLGDLVLVACSGGADSLALAAATAFVGPRLGIRAGAVSVDHGLQAGSREVSERAVAACAALGLAPVRVVGPDGGGAVGRSGVGPVVGAPTAPPGVRSGGPEGAARALRHDLLEATAAAEGATAVLLGHTRADQAETVLLGLARGSGTRALAGMAPIRGLLWRPLLDVTRAQTRRACAALDLTVWDDPTNAANGPLRTATGAALPRAALREHVLPELTRALGPGVEAALARTADLARDDADLLDDLGRRLYERAGTAAVGRHDEHREHGDRAASGDDHLGGAPVVLEVSVLAEAHPALRRRALRLAAVEAGADDGALARVHVRALDALITDWHGQGTIHLPGPTEAVRRYGRLVLRNRRIDNRES